MGLCGKLGLGLGLVSSCRVGGWGIHRRGMERELVMELGRGRMGMDMERRELGRGRVLGRKCGEGNGTW